MTDPLHLVCPHCQAVNRVQAADLGQAPACGKCHEPLFTGKPTTLNDANFDHFIARNDVPVLVDFWAVWCGPCRMMAPAFEQALTQLEPQVRLSKLDTDQAPEAATRLGIRSIPTLILFHRGQEIARHSGAIGTAEIVRWTRNALPA